MKNLCSLILLSLVLFSVFSATAQTNERNSAFVSGNIGIFLTSHDYFAKVYDSNLGIVFGGGFGLPLSSKTYIYAKGTYFSRSGVPWWTTYNFQNGILVGTTEEKDGAASFNQWIINLGLQYNVFLSEEYILPITGGVTYTSVSEEQRSSDGKRYSNVKEAMIGFFGGVGVERRFQESPFSVLAEVQYDYARHDIFGKYDGLNVALSLRYYFNDRRR